MTKRTNVTTIKNAEFPEVQEANPEGFRKGYLNEYNYVRSCARHLIYYIYGCAHLISRQQVSN